MTDFTTWELKQNTRINKLVDRVAIGHSISQQRHILKKMVAEASAALVKLRGEPDVELELDKKAWYGIGNAFKDGI